MPSEHDTFAAEFSAPFLAEQFGARDDQGDFTVVKVLEPGNAEPLELLGVSVGRLRINDEVDDERGSYRVDQIEDSLELVIPRQQLKLSKPYDPKIESKVSLKDYPGEAFVIVDVVSLTHSSAQVRCTRTHVVVQGRSGSEQHN